MKKLSVLCLLCCFLLSMAAVAGDKEKGTVTLEGKVLCAKCSLHEDRDKCQNVLVVEEEGESDPQYFYLVANEVNKEFGDVCMAAPVVRATGTLENKDGHTWLEATEIRKVEKTEG